MTIRIIFLGVLAGALGGVVGWLPGELIALAKPTDPVLRYVTVASYFVVLSASIGTALGWASGHLEGSRERTRQAAIAGALFGAVGGLVGSVPGELAFEVLRGVGLGLVGRALGWGVAGLFIGLAQGVRTRSRARMLRGMLGGFLGGYLGGGCFELISIVFPQGVLSRLAADVILGAALGGLIFAVEIWFSDAWLSVVSSGVQEGSRFDLSKPTMVLGSGNRDDVLLASAAGVVPAHAVVERKDKTSWLRPGAGPVRVNDRPLTQDERLGQENLVQIGQLVLLYQERQVACRSCGHHNAQTAKFCRKCGSALPGN